MAALSSPNGDSAVSLVDDKTRGIVTSLERGGFERKGVVGSRGCLLRRSRVKLLAILKVGPRR